MTWPGVAAIVLVAIAAASRTPDSGGWNGAAHFALVQSLADGTPNIDAHLNQSGDIAYVDGHFYAAKAPGLAMFSLPSYAVAKDLGAIPVGSPTSPPPGPPTQLTEDDVVRKPRGCRGVPCPLAPHPVGGRAKRRNGRNSGRADARSRNDVASIRNQLLRTRPRSHPWVLSLRRGGLRGPGRRRFGRSREPASLQVSRSSSSLRP